MFSGTRRRDSPAVPGYARGRLRGEEAALYDDLARRMAAGRRALPLRTSLDARSVGRVVELVRLDRPELSWPVDGISVLEVNGRPTGLELKGARVTPEPEARELERARDAILAGIPAGAGEFDRLAYLYGALTAGASYDRAALRGGASAVRAHTMAAALLEKNAVCEGYAIALQYLLHGAGIAAMRVTGTVRQPGGSGTGAGHSWVVARIDGRYSHVDPTWGLLDGLGPQMSGDADWDYLSLSDAEIRTTHSMDAGLPAPACGAVCDNWYSRGGYVMMSWDDAAFARIAGRQAALGRATVSLRVAVSCDFDDFVERAVEAVSRRGAALRVPPRRTHPTDGPSAEGGRFGRTEPGGFVFRTNAALRTFHLCAK